ncbi:MAG: hypothetical protein IPM69_11890 [Ignavibacteria bacterium]|nr:hypothetical protein [Ignavibacteria bacterium]
MSKQNYVRLNVALTVNGISCSISEELFSTFLEQIITYKQYKSLSARSNQFPEGVVEDLPPNMLAEIVQSRQLDHRKSVASNPDITKEAVATLLNDEQIEVIRELTENKDALKLMKSRDIYELARYSSDTIILRNLATVFYLDNDLAKDLSEHTPLVELLLKNSDLEVRNRMVEYLSVQRMEVERFDENLDAELVSMVNKSIESKRQERKGEI